MIPSAYVIHETDRRARFRIPSMKKNKSYFEEIKQNLSMCKEVEDVKTNSITGSVLVFHRGSLESVKAFSKTKDLFKVKKPARERWDLSRPMAAGIMGLSIFQMYNRNWLPPAWTLFKDALDILAKKRL